MTTSGGRLHAIRLEFGRRDLALLSASALAACASPAPPAHAQPRRGPGPDRLPPVPGPRAAGDIAGLLLSGTGAPAGTLVTLGCAFPAGALPRGAGLAARLVPGDRSLPAQLQVTARHPNGSARIGLLTLAPPSALGAGQHVGVLLARLPGTAL